MSTTSGRPRDARLDARILDAVEAVLLNAGYGGVTIDGVAREAGSTRAAVYRRYDDRSSMVVALLINRFGIDPAPDTGELKRDLEELQQMQVRLFSHPVIAAVIAGALSEAGQDPVLAREFHARFMAPRRASVAEMLGRGASRGEVGAAVKPETVSDLLTGPLLLHALVPGLGAMSEELVAATVQSALAVLGAPTA